MFLKQDHEGSVVANPRWQLIRRHQRDRPGRQEADAIQLSPVQQHLTEPQVVIGRGYHSTRTRKPSWLARRVDIVGGRLPVDGSIWGSARLLACNGLTVKPVA